MSDLSLYPIAAVVVATFSCTGVLLWHYRDWLLGRIEAAEKDRDLANATFANLAKDYQKTREELDTVVSQLEDARRIANEHDKLVDSLRSIRSIVTDTLQDEIPF